MLLYIPKVLISLVLRGMIFVIMQEIIHWRNSLNLMLLVLLLSFLSGSRLELMYVLHGFWVLVLLPQLLEITYFNRTKIINMRQIPSLDRLMIAAKGLLMPPNLLMPIEQGTLSPLKLLRSF